MFDKILVLSANKDQADTIKDALAGSYFVINALDVHTALQFIKRNNDLKAILLDIDLPRLVPEQFLEILSVHRSYQHIKTIVVGHMSDQMRIARCLEKGATDFITRPVDMDALKTLLELHLSNTEQTTRDTPLNATTMIFERLFNDAPIGVAISRVTRISDTDKITSVVMNPAYEKIIGRKNDSQNFDWRSITHPDDLAESEDLFNQLESRQISSYNRVKRYVHPDGSIVWVNVIVSSFDNENEDVFSYISIVQDITEQSLTIKKLSESERSKAVLLSHLPGLAYRCNYDRDWTMQFVSKGCKKLTGYDPEDLLDNKVISYNDLITQEYHHPLWLEWKRVLAARIPFSYEYQIITKEGVRKWVLELGEGVFDEKGEVLALEGIVIDIDYLKKMEETVKHKNEYDTLTNLHNRAYFEQLLDNDIKSGKIFNKALFGINFSSIQTLVLTNGYHYGMDLVKRISDILKMFQTAKCELFITHENRFCFYIQDYQTKEDLLDFYNQIVKMLEPILMHERISSGVGILEIRSTKYQDSDRLLKDTLIATEKALQSEGVKLINYAFFDKDMQLQIEREKILLDELVLLSEAAGDDGLVVDYQPVLDLKTDRVVSFEALSRFKSKRLGLVSPLEFIPLLERTKLIVPIGEKILSRSLKFLKHLNNLGYDVSMSINISAIQLLSQDFATRVIQKMNDVGVDPTKIWFEITESIFSSNYQRINQILGEIIKQGVKVTIDDFGTGYSSLHRVLELNTNGIKIDRAFIDGLEKISEDIAITKDIVSLGHKLNYLVVAEGIENETQQQYLKAYNCDRGQGYFFSRPLSQEKALEFLHNKNK